MTTTLTVENLEQIIRSNPGHAAFVRLANIYIEQGNCERAVDVCQAGLMAHPAPQVAIVAHIIEAKALFKLSRNDEALAHLENSTELLPDSPEAFKLSGALLHEMKMYREAMPFLSNALLRLPGDEPTERRLLECLSAVKSLEAEQKKADVPEMKKDQDFSLDNFLKDEDSIVKILPEAPQSAPSEQSAGEADRGEPFLEETQIRELGPSDEMPPQPEAEVPFQTANQEPADSKEEPHDSLSPFDLPELLADDIDESEIIPTMVNVSAFSPEGTSDQSADSASENPGSRADQNGAADSADSGNDQDHFPDADVSADGTQEHAPADSASVQTALPQKLSSETIPAEKNSETASSEAPSEAAAEEPSPFDLLTSSVPFPDDDDVGVPTVVGMDAYAPLQAGAAQKSGEGGTAPNAPSGFDEDQREMSAIFRLLDGGPESDSADSKADGIRRGDPSNNAAADDGREAFISGEDPAAKAEASDLPMKQNSAAGSLISTLLGGKPSREVPEPSASGWFSPESLAQKERESALKSTNSEKQVQAVPEELPFSAQEAESSRKISADFDAADAEEKTGEGTGDTAAAEEDSAESVADDKTVSSSGGGLTPAPQDAAPAASGHIGDSAEAKPEATGGDSVPFPMLRKPSIPPPLPPQKKNEGESGRKKSGKKPPALPVSAGILHEEGGILDELPDEAIFSKPPRPAVPSVAVTPQAAGEIAKQYEMELREKLLQQPPPNFWRRNWVKLSIALAVLILVGAGALVFKNADSQKRDERIRSWRSQSLRALPLATPQSYKDVIELSDRLISEMPEDMTAKAYKAYAAAAIIGHFGESEEYRRIAEEGRDAASQQTPGLVLAIDLWLATEKSARGTVERKIQKQKTDKMPNGFEKAEVLLLQSEQYIKQNDLKSAETFLNQAMNAAPDHVETFLTSGDLLMIPGDSRDPAKARTMYDRARQISPENVTAILGLVEASLDQEGIAADDDQTLLDILKKGKTFYEAAKASPPSWPESLEPRFSLAEGRLYSRMGRPETAMEILENGRDKWSSNKFFRHLFMMELGKAQVKAGAYGDAAVSFGDVVKELSSEKQKSRNTDLILEAKSEAAKAFIAIGNPQAALKFASKMEGLPARKAKSANRTLTVLRGIAFYEMRQLERAKLLLRSAAYDDGNLPPQAAIYMALIDAESGESEIIEQSLELLKGIRERSRWWPLAQSVRGRLLLQIGKIKEGEKALKDAIERDPCDYESPFALGQFEAERGNFQKARTLLETGFARNLFHEGTALWLAEVDLLLGDYEASERILQALAERKGGASAMEAHVYLSIARGDMGIARLELARLRKNKPNSEEAANASVLFFAMTGDDANFASELKRVSTHSSSERKLHTARRLVRMRRLEEAKSLYSSLNKGADSMNARTGLIEIGLKSENKKQQAEAQKQLAAMLKLAEDPKTSMEDDVRARLLAADALLQVKAKKKKAAIQRASAAVNANPFSPEARLAQAAVGLKWGSAEAAHEALELAIRLDVATADAYAELGLFLARSQRDPVRARFCLEMALRFQTTSADRAELQKALAGLTSDNNASSAGHQP